MRVHLRRNHTRPRSFVVGVALVLAGALAASAGVELTGVGALPAAAAPSANGYDHTLRVDDVRLIPDATPGDGVCATAATYGSTCTLLAAAQEANALTDLDPTQQVLVTLATPTAAGSIRQLDGSFANDGIVLLTNSATNTPTGFSGMIQGQAAMNTIVGGSIDGDIYGSILWFSGNVVIDLQNRLELLPPGDGGLLGTTLSFTGTDQVLRNFTNIAGAESAISVGKTATNVLIEHGTIANGPAGSGGLAYATERGINVVGGSTQTRVHAVTIDSMWRAGINVVAQSGNAGEPIHGLSITESTFSWENRDANNLAYGLGKWDAGTVRVDDLDIRDSSFLDFRRGAGYDSNVPISGDRIQTGGTSRVSGNTFQNTLAAASIYSDRNSDIRLVQEPAPGSSLSIDHNVFSNTTAWVPTGPAVQIAGGGSSAGRVSVTDNAFFGWNRNAVGQVISVTSTGGPSVALDRNTLSSVGGYTESATNSAELPGDIANPVHVANANGNVRTAFPSAAAFEPGACQLTVTTQRPQAGGGQPAYPIRVDAFAGGVNGAENYLGGVAVNSDADWGADGVQLTYPYSLGGAKLRLQTVDALGNVSPLSRTVEVAGADTCGPQLWVQQAETQADPSWSRSLRFEVLSSEPLANDALRGALDLGQAAAEIVSVVPASADASTNTRWSVTVRADAAGTVTLGVGAGSVSDRAGNTNPQPANTMDAPNNFIRSSDPAGVETTPGALIDNAVTYQLPIRLTAPESRTLSVSELGNVSDQFSISLEARDALGRTAFAPAALVTVTPQWSGLVRDERMPHPATTEAEQATLLPNQPTVSSTDAVIDVADREVAVGVAAVNNTIVDGTRSVQLAPVLHSDDPEFDGLMLDSLSVTVTDDDDPVAADSVISVTANGAVADGVATNSVSALIRNAAGQPVQNAVVSFQVPEGVNALSGADTIAGPSTVTATTDAAGGATLLLSSTRAHTDFAIVSTVISGGAPVGIGTAPAVVSFVPGVASAEHSALSVSAEQVSVDADPHRVTVSVVDAFGNAVSGATVIVTTDPVTTMSGDGIAQSGIDGIAFVDLSTEVAQSVTVVATIGGVEVSGSPASISFGAGDFSAPDSGVRASVTVAEANGIHEVLLEAHLHDAHGNLITSEVDDVVILSSAGDVAETRFVGDGRYEAILTSDAAATADASVTVGGVKASGEVTVTFVPTPSAPAANPSNGVTLTGRADANNTVVVTTETGLSLGSAPTDAFGWFVVTLTAPVVDGQVVHVEARDTNGFVSPVTNVTIDQVAPSVPWVDPSNGRSLTICAEDGTTVVVEDADGIHVDGSFGEFVDGCVVFTPSTRLTEQDDLRVVAVDPANNRSDPAVPLIDTTPPVAPTIAPSNGKTISGGVVEYDDQLVFLDGNGNRLVGTIAIDEQGRFTFSPAPRLQTGDDVVIRVTDPVGNAVEAPVLIDSTRPTAAVVAHFTGEMLAGYAEPGSTVTVTDEAGALLGTVIAGADGYFEVVYLLAPTRDETIAVLVADKAGNDSEELHLRLSGASVMLGRSLLSNDATQTVYGFGYHRGETVTATVNGTDLPPVTATAGPTGDVVISIPLDRKLALGDYTVTLVGSQFSLQSETFTVAEHSVWRMGESALATTGNDSSSMVAFGALLLLAGVAGILATRGRTRRSTRS
ncbi:Ig-like domain-containing protein [Lysinibacter cavernae]|uniref:Big-1 domain-containing protein n=1 Tax=Lysinibacter cavernae TaxID=1640652 RepID=A0A7X5R2C7_9MICO|nr:Ig-like domain-containing protein [Lysinibacter cavernae]NIH54403.1 hypothetical protein [Lysinibacter cavernae]